MKMLEIDQNIEENSMVSHGHGRDYFGPCGRENIDNSF